MLRILINLRTGIISQQRETNVYRMFNCMKKIWTLVPKFFRDTPSHISISIFHDEAYTKICWTNDFSLLWCYVYVYKVDVSLCNFPEQKWLNWKPPLLMQLLSFVEVCLRPSITNYILYLETRYVDLHLEFFLKYQHIDAFHSKILSNTIDGIKNQL